MRQSYKEARRNGGLLFRKETSETGSDVLGLMRFIRDERGATAIEYGLMVAAFALAIVLVVFTMGDELVAMTDDILVFIQGRESMS